MWLFQVFIVFWLRYYCINTRIYYSLEIYNNPTVCGKTWNWKNINNIYNFIIFKLVNFSTWMSSRHIIKQICHICIVLLPLPLLSLMLLLLLLLLLSLACILPLDQGTYADIHMTMCTIISVDTDHSICYYPILKSYQVIKLQSTIETMFKMAQWINWKIFRFQSVKDWVILS